MRVIFLEEPVITQRASARSEYSPSNVNWLTAIVMGLFHVGAVAAFFYFSWTNLMVARSLIMNIQRTPAASLPLYPLAGCVI